MSSAVDLLSSMLGTDLLVYDLSRPLQVGMPQSPNHPEFRHVLVRRHGDTRRLEGGSAANDLIVTGTHVGTHVDALGHISHAGRLHGGTEATEAQLGGRFEDHGIHTFVPFVGRGVLLDVASAKGLDDSSAVQEITVDDLEATAVAQGTQLREGDAILVRSGWGRNWEDRELYQGQSSGVPGPGEAGAIWLAGYRPAVVGADTIAFEHVPPGQGHAQLPVHRVLLVEHGINIIETLDLEQLAADGVHEFLFILNPLNIVGATAAPVRPLALIPALTPSPEAPLLKAT